MGLPAEDYQKQYALDRARRQKASLSDLNVPQKDQSGNLSRLNGFNPVQHRDLQNGRSNNYDNRQPLSSSSSRILNPARFQHLADRKRDDEENEPQIFSEEEKMKRLEEARGNTVTNEESKSEHQVSDKLKSMAKMVAPSEATSLLKQINFIGDIPFAIALGAAVVTDLLDIVDTEFIILPALVSALCAIVIFMMLLLVGANNKRKEAQNFLSKLLPFVLDILGSMANSIPVISYLPVETLTVALIYVIVLKERAAASAENDFEMDDSMASI